MKTLQMNFYLRTQLLQFKTAELVNLSLNRRGRQKNWEPELWSLRIIVLMPAARSAFLLWLEHVILAKKVKWKTLRTTLTPDSLRTHQMYAKGYFISCVLQMIKVVVGFHQLLWGSAFISLQTTYLGHLGHNSSDVKVFKRKHFFVAKRLRLLLVIKIALLFLVNATKKHFFYWPVKLIVWPYKNWIFYLWRYKLWVNIKPNYLDSCTICYHKELCALCKAI